MLLYAYSGMKIDERYIPTALDPYFTEVSLGERRISLGVYDIAGANDFVRLSTLIYPWVHRKKYQH